MPKWRRNHIARATATAQTGVEMEALVAVSAAALTVYDMCKALDKAMEISDIYLVEKRGGKSGDYLRGVRHGQATIAAAQEIARRSSGGSRSAR